MPQSVAIAIAEGNLDPITMEAFHHSPNTPFRSNPIKIESSGRFPRIEAPLLTPKETCFVSFSSQRSTEKSVVTEEEKKGHNKSEALEKLIHVVNEAKPKVGSFSLKVPNNNPFKRQKAEQVKDEVELEEISWVTKEEKSEIVFAGFESQESVNSKAIDEIKSRGKRKGKSEKMNKISGTKNTTILNFFSRV